MFPWATLGANDINKPFSEMTPEDKAIMWGKYETEIVETESDYIDKLRLIKELYMAPLVALTKTGNEKNAIITATQITHIFSNLDIILNYNTILYKQMREWKEKVDEEKAAAAAAAAAAASKKKKKDKEEPVRRDSEGDCPPCKVARVHLPDADGLLEDVHQLLQQLPPCPRDDQRAQGEEQALCGLHQRAPA